MRHRSGLRKLNRTSSHRLAMLRNMTVSLLKHEAIKTTLPKAKELRKVAEPIITLGKNPTLANRRLAFDRLRDRDIVVKLFDELGRAIQDPQRRIPAQFLKFGFPAVGEHPRRWRWSSSVDRPEPQEGEAKEEKAA
jgi:large subunit ribosomal protein L17